MGETVRVRDIFIYLASKSFAIADTLFERIGMQIGTMTGCVADLSFLLKLVEVFLGSCRGSIVIGCVWRENELAEPCELQFHNQSKNAATSGELQLFFST